MAEIGKFDTHVATRQISRWQFTTLEPMQYADSVHGAISVPEGFTSDLASIRILREVVRYSASTATGGGFLLTYFSWLGPTLWLVAIAALSLYAILAGYGMRAAILHDWLYRGAGSSLGISRKECDGIFYRALTKGDGTARWRAFIFYAGVRLGGFTSYKKA